MFNKILIANRGEIACRIMATAKKMGVLSVAVYSDADIDACHVKAADEAVCIGPAPALESYLNIPKVIDAALRVGADAVHPGYGFLSENVDFCRACEEAGLVFIGPPAKSIEVMGSKSQAKTLMSRAGVPLVPGYHGDDQSLAVLHKEADKMGYPVLIKASAGGGGKGMRVVNSSTDFESALVSAKREAISSFANDEVLLEKYLKHPRHIEVQVFFDQQGNAVYLFERDCSTQRRHQKIIEEAPAPGMSESLRKKMGVAAVNAAKAIQYVGAGTIEFLVDLDSTGTHKNFYFMEMNTRLQVEHPVTEMITGLDLVEWQINIANGESLPLQQDELTISGHAIEVRIYAENPSNNFYPDTGKITALHEPISLTNVRIDSGVEKGSDVSVYYDPMLAKLIVWGEDRQQAMTQLEKALSGYYIGGVETNVEFLRSCIKHPAFRRGEINTHFIDDNGDAILALQKQERNENKCENLALIALMLILQNEEHDNVDPWSSLHSWRLNSNNRKVGVVNYDGEPIDLSYQIIENPIKKTYRVTADEKISEQKLISELRGELRRELNEELKSDLTVEVSGSYSDGKLDAIFSDYRLSVKIICHAQDASNNDKRYTLLRENGNYPFHEQAFKRNTAQNNDSSGVCASEIIAPMNGHVISVSVREGQSVKKGDELVVIEAMKMEHTLKASADGKVEKVLCENDQLVKGGEKLVKMFLQS